MAGPRGTRCAGRLVNLGIRYLDIKLYEGSAGVQREGGNSLHISSLTHRQVRCLAEGDNLGRDNAVVGAGRLLLLGVPPLDPFLQAAQARLGRGQAHVVPEPAGGQPQEAVQDVSHAVRVERGHEFAVELLDDAAKLQLRESGWVENLGVQVGEGRSQVALDEPVPPNPDDARRCVFWGVGRNMGVQVRIARMLRAPFFAGILLVGVAHDRRVARRDGRADARQSRGGGVAGIQDIRATFQILREAPRLFGRVGLGWRHDLLALAFVKSRRPGSGGAFCGLEDEAEGGGSALLVAVSKPCGPGRVVSAKVGERGAGRCFLDGRRGDAPTLLVVRVANGAREADPLLASCAAFDVQTRPGRGGMPAQALLGEGKERIVAGSDVVGAQGEVELEVLEGDDGRRRGGRASPTGEFRGDSRGRIGRIPQAAGGGTRHWSSAGAEGRLKKVILGGAVGPSQEAIPMGWAVGGGDYCWGWWCERRGAWVAGLVRGRGETGVLRIGIDDVYGG